MPVIHDRITMFTSFRPDLARVRPRPYLVSKDTSPRRTTLLTPIVVAQREHAGGHATEHPDATPGHPILELVLDLEERRICLAGELDIAGTPTLLDAIGRLLRAGPTPACIDLSGLSFIDASGLGCLVTLDNQLAAAGAALHITGVRAGLRRIFALGGLNGLLDRTSSPGASGATD